jgi:hypothetical protein
VQAVSGSTGSHTEHTLSLASSLIDAESIARLQRRVQAFIDNKFQPANSSGQALGILG